MKEDRNLMEDELDLELEKLVDMVPDDRGMERKIEQNIKRNVQNIVLKTIAVLAAVTAALFLIISPFMDAVFLNPVKMNREPDRQMLVTLNNYWETVEPYVEIVSFHAEKKGFARYAVEMQATNRRDWLNIGKANVWVEVVRGKYKNWQDPEALMTHYMGRFEEQVEPARTEAEIEETNKAILDEIRDLPQSAVIYLSIGAKTPKKLDKLRKEKVKLTWIQVYQPDVQFQGGLGLGMRVAAEENDSGRENLSVEELKKIYLSNLEDLIAHEKIWGEFGLHDSRFMYPADGGSAMERLKETYEDARTLETLESKNYCISGKRDEVAAYLEKTDVAHIQVDDVKLSSLAR